MTNGNCSVTACRNCLNYQLEGRRGGLCRQLGVPVQSDWKPCPLAAPIFSSVAEDAPLGQPLLPLSCPLVLPAEAVPLGNPDRVAALHAVDDESSHVKVMAIATIRPRSLRIVG
ncbi:hypothetical protein ACQ4M4_04030 [Leptolyngbya sp. AN02str]|uniref:hypothetical protein n=1 Tax=Leptolyngbya sp. AN02str TaxID=3423363 RepID=UPI003D3137D2